MSAPQIPNYSLRKSQDATGGRILYVGVRDADGAPVVLKGYASDDAADPSSHVRREFEALRAAEGPGVPRAIELLTDEQPPLLVQERIAGDTLASRVETGPLSPEAFVEIALQLCAILERIHAAGFLYCKLSPADIYLEPQRRTVYLVDFGAARVLGAVERSSTSISFFQAASLAYVSPEQTGRMARGVDPRSDLYALGSVFYFALIGRPPFESEDPLALVHAHMARMPVPPLDRRSELPPTLSRIVLKLLQKEPSDRYQTAHALACDLRECQEQLRRSGRIADDFPLGTADLPMRPMFRARLYGREAESRALREAYERIRNDTVELVLLMGPPGVGKSALIQELRTPLSETGGYLAQGKFDLYRRDVPYSGLVAALESLVHQILRESDARVALWRSSLEAALGNLATVVIELVPDLAILLPDAAPVPKLGPRETQARLVYTLQRLVLGCGRREHPLVLFIDDLQWADPGSRSVLEALLTQARGASLLVVTTCRNEHEPSWRPIATLAEELEKRGVHVTQLEIEPLGEEASAEMLADALGHPIDQVRGLAERVAAKTGSNPLWIQQFVSHMHDLGLIQYVPPHGWTWEESAIEAADTPEGAVGLLVAKLERLPAKPRSVIQFASCVSDEFEVELLCELTGEPKDAIEPPLFTLTKEGLLAPSAGGFRFVHDRIREAAQALLSEDERARLHHRTGCHLLERAPLAIFTDRVFEIADHFNRSLAHLSADERHKALELNVAAGSRALASGASQTASNYLSVGRKLLLEQDWDDGSDLAFRLLFLSADAAFQTQDADLALLLLDDLDTRVLNVTQQASVAARRIACYTAVRPDQAFPYILEQLRRFGVRVPAQPSFLRARLAIELTCRLLPKPQDTESYGRAPSTNGDWAASILITGAGGAAIVRHGGFFLLCLTTAQSLRLFRRYGAVPGMTLSLAAFAGILSGIRVRLRNVEPWVEATNAWCERLPSPIDVRARFSLHCFTLPYLKPRRSLLAPLATIAQEMLELGDPEYALYASGHRAIASALCGEPLSSVIDEFERLAGATQVVAAKEMLTACAEIYRLLAAPTAESDDWTSPPEPVAIQLRANLGGDMTVPFHWFLALCYVGRLDLASEMLPRFTLHGFSTNPTSGLDWMLFRAICIESQARRRPWLGRRRAAWYISALLESSRGRILPSADFGHIPPAMLAEAARLRNKPARALNLYQQAAKTATERGYRHHAALLHERRASLLREDRRDMERTAALQHALELYRQWGAIGKVRQIERLLRA